MSCRLTRRQGGETHQPATCRDCAAQNLETFYTSSELGFALCPTCFEAMRARGAAKEDPAPPTGSTPKGD